MYPRPPRRRPKNTTSEAGVGELGHSVVTLCWKLEFPRLQQSPSGNGIIDIPKASEQTVGRGITADRDIEMSKSWKRYQLKFEVLAVFEV